MYARLILKSKTLERGVAEGDCLSLDAQDSCGTLLQGEKIQRRLTIGVPYKISIPNPALFSTYLQLFSMFINSRNKTELWRPLGSHLRLGPIRLEPCLSWVMHSKSLDGRL